MKTTLRSIAAVTIAAATLSGCAFQNQKWHADCTVQAKDMVYEKDDDGALRRVKRVSTTCGAFDVKGSLAGNYNDWDAWQQLEIGKVYDIRTGGYRVGFFSSFPTVLEVRAK